MLLLAVKITVMTQVLWTWNIHHSVGEFGAPRINLFLSKLQTLRHVKFELLELLNCKGRATCTCFNVVKHLLILFLHGDDLSSESVVNCTYLSQCNLIVLVQSFVIEGELEWRTNLSNSNKLT
jgi:hypothetical protein